MRFGRGPLGCLFGGCGSFVFMIIFMLLMSILTNGGIEELLEEIFR